MQNHQKMKVLRFIHVTKCAREDKRGVELNSMRFRSIALYS